MKRLAKKTADCFPLSINAGLSLPSEDRHGMEEKKLDLTGQQECLAMDIIEGARPATRRLLSGPLRMAKILKKGKGVIHTLNGTTNTRGNNN